MLRILLKVGLVNAFCVALMAGSITFFPPGALAQTYPNKPVRFIVPFPPSGMTDILARIIGQKLAGQFGQPFVMDNRPGAGGNLGSEYIAKARPDGYTLGLGSTGLSFSPTLYKNLNYDPIKDFAPISLAAQAPNVLTVRASLPVHNLKEFVEYVKANPGKLNYGSGGIGTPQHLATELLKSVTKIDIVHVKYKGATAAMMSMIGGEVDICVVGVMTLKSVQQTGKVRAIAVLSDHRSPSLPEVPTAKEAGVDNLMVPSWFGILAPARTPRDIIGRLNTEWRKIATMPDTIEKMQNVEFEAMSGTPEQFAEFLKAETVRWGRVIKDADIRLD